MSEQKSFPLPSDLKVVPGTEAAQAAYPVLHPVRARG